MSQDPGPSTSRRTGLDVQREIVAGLQSLVLTDDVILDRQIGIGGYAEVYEGNLLDPRVNMWTKVAVKRFRVIMNKEKDFAEVRDRLIMIFDQYMISIKNKRKVSSKCQHVLEK